MITPTGNQRSPYNYSRQQRNNSQISFANLLAKSAAAGATGVQIQRSALVFGAKEDVAESAPQRDISELPRIDLTKVWIADSDLYRLTWKAAEPTYPKSIFDLSPKEYEKAAKDAEEAAYYMPTEGKTKLEIYNDVKAIYESYLGKDFRVPQVLCWRWPPDSSHESNLRNAEFDFQRIAEMHGAKGRYDGMTKDEIRLAIRDQYPEDTTLADCLLMSKDLYAAGLDKTDLDESYAEEIIRGIMFTMGNGDAARTVFKHMLDMPADYDAMKASFERFEMNDRTTELLTDMEDVYQLLCSWAGWDEDVGGGILEMLEEMKNRGEIVFNEYGFLVDAKPGEKGGTAR